MGRVRTRVERLEQLANSSTISNVTGTLPIVVTTTAPGVRNVSAPGLTPQDLTVYAKFGDISRLESRINALMSAQQVIQPLTPSVDLQLMSRVNALYYNTVPVTSATTDPLVIYLTAQVFGA